MESESIKKKLFIRNLEEERRRDRVSYLYNSVTIGPRPKHCSRDSKLRALKIIRTL